MNNPDPEVQRIYKEIFQKHFDKLISEGKERDQAAGEALLFLQQYINNIRTKPPQFISEENEESDDDHNNKDKNEIENKMIISKEIKENKIEIENNLSKDLTVDEISTKSVVKTMSYDELIAIFSNTGSEESSTEIIKTIGYIFSSSEILNNSFKNEETNVEVDVHMIVENNTKDINNNIDLNLVQINQLFKCIMKIDNICVRNSLSNALETLSANMAINYLSHITSDSLKQYIIALEYPDLLDPSKDVILRNILIALDKLPLVSKKILYEWIKTAAGIERYLKYIIMIRQFITLRIYESSVEIAKLATRCLGILYLARGSYPTIAINEFYNDAINDDYMQSREGIQKEFGLWLRDDQMRHFEMMSSKSTHCLENNKKSIISYPFILSPSTKASILELDAHLQMRREMDHEIQHAISRGERFVTPYLVLRVSRERILSDTLSELFRYQTSDYKKPLKVVFDDEDGIDAGGVRKEFYQLMLKQLLDVGYGMFKYYPESRYLWFNSDSYESSNEFELVGLLLGVAIYNSIIIDLQMPSAVYKKLKKEKMTLTDLEELQPSLAQGLKSLLDFDGDVENTFHAVFQLSYDVFGEIRTFDLKENGGSIPVTNENRHEYVELYVDYQLNKSMETQFTSFEKGFRKVCGGNAINLFEAAELELLVCGSKKIDFFEMQQGTKYEDGYDENDNAIKLFWMILSEYDDEEKRLFLKFVSGSDRAPIDGLEKLNLVISKNGCENGRLPSAHTCFNHLLLPDYSTIEIMKERINYAMRQAEGFGLR